MVRLAIQIVILTIILLISYKIRSYHKNVVIIFIVSIIIDQTYHLFFGSDFAYYDVQLIHILIDVGIMASLTIFIFVFNRWILYFMSVVQFLSLSSHAMRVFDDELSPAIYYFIEKGGTWGAIIMLAASLMFDCYYGHARTKNTGKRIARGRIL